MDPINQAGLDAAIGHAVFQRQLGCTAAGTVKLAANKALPRRRIPGVVLMLITLFCGPAALAELPPEVADKPLWEVRLAAFGRYGAAYPAAEENQFNFIPLPFPIYRGKFLRLGDNAEKPIQGRVFQRDRIQLNVDFNLNFGSDSEDIDVRNGMPNLDFMLEAGPEVILPFLDSDLTRGYMELALQLRGAFSFDGIDPTWQGLVFNPELRWIRPLSRKNQEFKVRITPAFASNDYMDYYYGVAPEFATPERPAYAARGGYLGTELTLSYRHPVTRRLEVWTGIRGGYYGGSRNEDSPLFASKTSGSVYAAFMYKFWESKGRESAD